jgi:hypothetical protein
VPKKLFKPPKDVINEWPEVFEDMYIKTMPIEYIHCAEISFGDGRVWEVNIAEQLQHSSVEEVASRLMDAFREYQSEIATINFQVDIGRLKHDITNSTKDILDKK